METNVNFRFNSRNSFDSETGPAVGQNASSEPSVDVVFVSQAIGSDANPGTEVSPILTLYDAINVASEANIVLIDGDFPYYGSINLRTKTLFARDVVTWRLGKNDALFGTGGQNNGLFTAGEDNTVFAGSTGRSVTGKVNANILQRGEKIVTNISDPDFGATVNTAFPELTFSTVIGGITAQQVQPTIYEGNTIYHLVVPCAAATYGFPTADSARVMVNVDDTLTIINYFFLQCF